MSLMILAPFCLALWNSNGSEKIDEVDWGTYQDYVVQIFHSHRYIFDSVAVFD
jgi:hypothetical protein